MRALILVAMIGMALTASAKPLAGRDQKEIALHIAVIDHMAFSRAAFDEVDEFIRENLPNRELKSVAVETSVLRKEPERVRKELTEGLRLAPTDMIGHLIIDTHGATVGNGPEGVTRLANMGDFGAGGMNADLESLLAPLRGHLSSSVVIVLNSCSTLCGTTPEAVTRVSGLLRSLGAKDAQVYGSVVEEVESPGALTGRVRWRDYLGDMGQLKLFMTMGLALGVPVSIVNSVSNGHSISFGALSAAVVGTAAALFTASAAMKALLARFGNVNLGRLLVFRNGRLVRARDVEKYPARFQIYGTCSSLFSADP